MSHRFAALPMIFAALWPGVAAAQQPPVEPPSTAPVTCKTDGYDVVILNNGADALAEGTEISWSVRFARSEGVHALDSELDPGRFIVLTGALGSSYLTNPAPCIADLVEPGAAEKAAPG